MNKLTSTSRQLACIMFTDIVGSTEAAGTLGDREWRRIVERHDEVVRPQLERHRGEELTTMGDGFLATFDGPARAIRAACAIRDSARRLGIKLQAGLHTGECDVMKDRVGGPAVELATQITTQATIGEVLVTSTVKDLVAGSGIRFSERGATTLGKLGEWRLSAVER